MNLIQYFQQDCDKNAQRPVWISPEFYYDLLEIGMVTFDDNGAYTMGHQLRVVEEMPVEYKFTDA